MMAAKPMSGRAGTAKVGRVVLVGIGIAYVPCLCLVVAVGAIGWAWLGLAGAGAGAIVAATASWALWALAIGRWRRWAAASGITAAELERAAVRVGLVGPRGSRLEQAEHGANLPLFWGLIASGLLICAGLGLELSGSRAESFHAVTTTAYLVMAAGIALDASQREPPLASWLGIGALVLAAGVQWMFLGSGLSLWVWVPIKVLPAIAGIAALLFLVWTPVHERHDARGLYLARLWLVAVVGLAAIAAALGRQ
jgi:hypothetical protein